MNNTSSESIHCSIIYYNDIYDTYNKNVSEIINIKKEKLQTKMPANLQTAAKLALFNTFGEQVTQVQFLQLLQYQTTGADFLNVTYIAKYYKLQYDNNQMLIWTDACPYTSFKEEAINNWYIWHVLNTHAMFSKYTNTLLEFVLQSRLECNIFPMRENFRDDLYFPKLHLINATNESQHLLLPQRALDAEKIALNKMNGNSVISLYTTSLVNVKQIKKNIQNNLCDDVTLLNSICMTHNITDEKSIKIVHIHLLMKVRAYFKITYVLAAHVKNTQRFVALVNSSAIEETVTQMLYDYLKVVNKTIHQEVHNSEYLQCYKSTLLDTVLSACLNNFDFRQDYIQIVLAESLLGTMQSAVSYLQYIETVVQIQQPKQYQNMYDTKVSLYQKHKKISEQFISKPQDFVNLFNLKLKSLRDANNTYVITFNELCSLFKIESQKDSLQCRAIINITCDITIETTNDDVHISWKQLQEVIFVSNNKPKLQQMLLFYYSEIDTIYEVIINRLQQDAARFVCTPDNYNNYTGRLYKKFSSALNKYKSFGRNLLKHNAALNGIINELRGTELNSVQALPVYVLVQPAKTVLEPLLGFTKIVMLDAEHLARSNIAQRIASVNADFTMLTEKYIVIKNDIDADFVDPDEL